MALWLAAGGFPGWHCSLVFTAGHDPDAQPGCAVNDVADKTLTARRAHGATPHHQRQAVFVKRIAGIGGRAGAGLFALVLTTNPATDRAVLRALAITIVYPFTKRFFDAAGWLLGGLRLGIPMAFGGHPEPRAGGAVWWADGGNLAWVLAYDTEYAMVDRNDDLKIGIRPRPSPWAALTWPG